MSIARNPNESFADFKERRITDNLNNQRALKPKMFWDSYYQGTYVKAKQAAKQNKGNK
jgi:hypothetical protein